MRARFLITAVAAISALVCGASVATAQTVQPNFTCPSPAMCLFPNRDFTGNYADGSPVVLVPGDHNGHWHTFGSVGADNPNPGSINNNSNSIMFIFAQDRNFYGCLDPRKWVVDNAWGWFFIQLNTSTCPPDPNANHPPGP